MIKGCIFDLDGVVVDTAKYHYKAWKELANRLGFEFTEQDNERLKGVSRMRSLEILLEIGGIEASEEQMLEMATEKNSRYLDYITKMEKSEILPGVREFLTSLREAGIKVSLGSASKNAQLILERIEVMDLFDAIADGNNVAIAKPDPEVFNKAAELLDLPAKDCIVFEDAVAGIEAAHSANMLCIAVGSKENLPEGDAHIPGFEGFTIEQMHLILNK